VYVELSSALPHADDCNIQFLGLTSPRLIYVESFARVESLSLTAKILRRFVDVFLVQWEQGKALGADYRGILV
jgi:beta-1,4-N-acetylglucosaminyltransferase